MTLVQVLDHGSVELVDSIATDQMVLKSMLVSTGKDQVITALLTEKVEYPDIDRNDPAVQTLDKTVDRNRGRINYLMREKHGTPFEHNSFTFRVCAPIFVLREWHRHRIGWSYNEQSGRYMELGDKWYIPSEVRTSVGKPGHYTYEPLSTIEGGKELEIDFKNDLRDRCERSYRMYQDYLEEGVAPEQARLFLHVNHYSSMYATCNARSLMKFLELRADPTAQWEIQQYAHALESYFKEAMPVTHKAFIDNGRVAP